MTLGLLATHAGLKLCRDKLRNQSFLSMVLPDSFPYCFLTGNSLVKPEQLVPGIFPPPCIPVDTTTTIKMTPSPHTVHWALQASMSAWKSHRKQLHDGSGPTATPFHFPSPRTNITDLQPLSLPQHWPPAPGA